MDDFVRSDNTLNLLVVMLAAFASGAGEFDQFYSGMQVAGHTEAVALFSKEAKSDQGAELVPWASKTLPILKEHLTQIQAIHLSHSSASRNK